MSLNKKGNLLSKNTLELILGGAIVLLLLVLLYNLIAPTFNVGDETAKSYFDSLEKEIALADSDKIGSFHMWQPEDKDDKREFFLVYFGNHSSFGTNLKFYSLGDNLNRICICYIEDGVDNCKYCRNLAFPVLSDDAGEGYVPWAVGLNEKLEITKKGDHYEFLTE